MTIEMPVLFVGHGNPMNAILENDYTKAWRALGKTLPRPSMVLVISAHWYFPGTAVTAMELPRTIHDFGGFPQELYDFSYPAHGSLDLAQRVKEVMKPVPVELDSDWGLDHGTWSVLCHLFPKADIPVVQLSINETKPPEFHYQCGRRLAPLRQEGVLILGSGNLIHNLHAYAWGRHQPEPYDWAIHFEQRARALILSGDHQPLINYEAMGKEALLSAPTPDHFLPLLYILGASHPQDKVSFPVEGIDGGSVSMLAVELGKK